VPKEDRQKLKADPDDGVTRVANLLLEALAMARLTGMEKGAILYLWRRTYGWHDPQHPRMQIKERHIGLNEWTKWLHCSKPFASEILSKLTKHNIIIQKSNGQGKGYIYSMNTYISQWNGNCIDKEHLHRCITVTQQDNSYTNDTITVTQQDNRTVIQGDNRVLHNSVISVTQQDNTSVLVKERIKESILKKSSTSTSKENTDVVDGDILESFKNNLKSRVTPAVKNKLLELLNTYGKTQLLYAIDIAGEHEARLVSYVATVLINKNMDKDFENRT
jgi:phage replication O-like protein O